MCEITRHAAKFIALLTALSTTKLVLVCGGLQIAAMSTTNANDLFQLREVKKTCRELQDDLKRYRRKQKVLEDKVLMTPSSTSAPNAPSSTAPNPPSTPYSSTQLMPTSPLPPADPSPSPLGTPSLPQFNGLTMYELEDFIRHKGSDGWILTKILARKVFSEEQLKSCSVTGKRTAMCGSSPRPPLDCRCLEAIQKVVMGVCPDFTRDKFVTAIQNVQKVLRQKVKH